ncbi:hypothetical protein TNCV_4893191, partial [Trichonephila clavipes]
MRPVNSSFHLSSKQMELVIIEIEVVIVYVGRKLMLDGTLSELPQKSTPSIFSSFQQTSEARCEEWVYAVVPSLISLPSWDGGTLNSRRAGSPLVRLVEGEEWWGSPSLPPLCPPLKWVKTSEIVLPPA